MALASSLHAVLIPEYARSYLEGLNRHYEYRDLEIIAKHQIEVEASLTESCSGRIMIMDTWLIITKVWYEVVFGVVPDWIEKYISLSEIDLFLVCKPDLPWIADPVRENGGEMRQLLFDRYCREIEHYGFSYGVVEGFGEERFQNALNLIKSHGMDKPFTTDHVYSL